MDLATAFLRLLISVAVALCLILVHSTLANGDRTAYDILEFYNLPAGLLPKGVTRYELNYTTGKFSVYFNDTCTCSQRLFKMKYEPTVKGYVSNGKLSSVEGMNMSFFLIWTKVADIIRQGNDLDFYVDAGKAVFPMDYFEDSPLCGCGMINSSGGNRPAREEAHAKSF